MDPMMQSNAQARHNGGAAKPSTPSFPATSMHMNTNGNAATAKKTTVKAQKWSEEEHRTCLRLYEEKGRMYKEIAQQMGTRSVSQVGVAQKRKKEKGRQAGSCYRALLLNRLLAFKDWCRGEFHIPLANSFETVE